MKHKLLFLGLAAALGGMISFTQVNADETQQTQRAAEKQKGKSMKIRIKIESKTLTATLDDNPTTRDFVALLPLTLTLRDYNRTEKISGLPKKLSIDGAPSGSDPDAVTVGYRTIHHRPGADFHRPIPSPSQAHERGPSGRLTAGLCHAAKTAGAALRPDLEAG